MSQPTRQPVAANSSAGERAIALRAGQGRRNAKDALLVELTVSVRSHMPGRDAMRMCSLLSYTIVSY